MARSQASIHRTAEVYTDSLGAGTRVWQFVVILQNARIGANCNICSHVFIENDVILGNNVTVKSGVQLWDGLRVDDDVFIGPNVSFTNDRHPRSANRDFILERTKIEKGASIGAGAVILPGITIGHRAVIAAGAIVTHNVPDDKLVVGTPGRIRE